MKKKLLLTLLASVMACLWLTQEIIAAKGIYIPLFTYKTGPFAVKRNSYRKWYG